VHFAVAMPGLSHYPPLTQPWHLDLGPADFQRLARTVDELGYDSIVVSEHILLPNDMAELMGPYWTHAFTSMCFIAGATTRIRVSAGVIVLPYHDPVVMAKAVATLDVLSGGRVTVAVGVGHAEREFEVLRVPFHQRGRLTDEYLAAMVELWTSDEPCFHGEYIDFEDIAFEPKPVQRPHPPIWIGGNSRAAMRRAAAHEAWLPWLITPAELPECLDYIRSRPEFGDPDRPFDVAMDVSMVPVDEHHLPVSDPSRPRPPVGMQELIDTIGELSEVGVTWAKVPPAQVGSLDEHLEHLQRMSEELFPLFH
jgi:probable F420-dependent oxidoreductase